MYSSIHLKNLAHGDLIPVALLQRRRYFPAAGKMSDLILGQPSDILHIYANLFWLRLATKPTLEKVL